MRRIRRYSEFGLWASGILAELNMTQSELAEEVGCSKTMVSELFTGKSNNRIIQKCIEELLLQKIKEQEKEKYMHDKKEAPSAGQSNASTINQKKHSMNEQKRQEGVKKWSS